MRYKSGLFLASLLLGFAVVLFATLFLRADGELFQRVEPRVWSLLNFTLYQAFLSTIISLFVGTLLAWSLAHQKRFFGRFFLVAVFSSSLVLPSLVVVFGIISIYGRSGVINNSLEYLFGFSFGSFVYGLGGILLAHVYLNASYASRSLLHAFESIPIEKYKLSKSLGFSTWKRFVYVEFAYIKGVLLTVGSTIFLLCFSSFAIVLLLGGSPVYNTLEVAIYEAVKLEFDIPLAIELALIQLVVSSVFVIGSSNFKMPINSIKISKFQLPWQEPKAVKFVQVVVIILFSLFFLTPLLATFFDGLGADFKKIFSDVYFQKSFYTSMALSFVSTVLTLIFALALSDARVKLVQSDRTILNTLVSFSGNLYLAIPSLILGLGFFLLSLRFEVSEFFWTTLALLTANVLISLPFALSVLTPQMQKVSNRYDKLARSLNLSSRQRWVSYEYPFLSPSLGYIAALSFCFSMGDLGIIALFGSDSYTTLPWYLYQLMGSYRTADAAGVALILLVLTLVAFVMLPKVFGRDDVRDS